MPSLWPMRRFLSVVAGLCVGAALVAQESVHFPPTDQVVILAMRDVPAVQLAAGFMGRTLVGATGSFTYAEFEDGAGAVIHHHTREQVNVGIDGAMERALARTPSHCRPERP